jgi:hypothetical protein
MSPDAAGLHPNHQAQALPEVRDIAATPGLSGWKLGLGFPQSPERSLYPWTLLLDEWLNVSQGEAARNDDLHALRVDQDSRM